jgi:hypothetical protein
MSGTFTCVNCNGTFPKGWSDEDAEADYAALWGQHMGEPRVTLCEECDREFKAWLKENPQFKYGRKT